MTVYTWPGWGEKLPTDILDKKNKQASFSHDPKIVRKVLPWEITY